MTHTKDEWVDSVMEQAQVFASAWSLVGSRFDSGNGLENAEEEKKALRAMLATPPAQPAVPDSITDDSESPEYRSGWNECRQTMLEMMK
jgi:hypothetical protein